VAGDVLGAGVAGAVGAGALEAGACEPGAAFLCFGVSGSTSGPFWPHAKSSPARQTGTHRRAIFMARVYRVPRHTSLTGTSDVGSRSDWQYPKWRY
jgi:hypothetical protein